MTLPPAQEPQLEIHPLDGIPNLKLVLPSVECRAEHCEIPLNIGVFFDGTGNNYEWDDADDCQVGQGTQLSRRKESNVARLFFAYPEDPARGYYRTYISGVGTPCIPIGETEPARFGMAAGEGGDGRINYGLLSILNAVHSTLSRVGQGAYDEDVLMALCRNGKRHPIGPEGDRYSLLKGRVADELALRKVGMQHIGGLLMNEASINGKPDRSIAQAFYQREVKRLTELIAHRSKPKLAEISIDVFGFSRGAALARTFCSWLDELFDGNRLCGVPTTIRFMGLFDTVASVGLPNNPRTTANLTHGHLSWGNEAYLRIPARVKNCVHYVAMHENRPSFPLDRVFKHNGLPSNCHEYAFPGMHSDVGGGYGVNEQGRGRMPADVGRNALNSEKLSQIPLEYMLKTALSANVPLDPRNARGVDENDARYA
ncbi:DUF2235 domain-containing protein [Pseudomonas sp. R5(2019)]|uniref:T6SS phospholipase effector Tle1-like catalytic domain-containing protein n=1 Tax=Pseudomonas sp. R5(2019) TaxID=2697566 RepID=UPI0014120D11|nr:DUF2235 domain-containing protein [Pseudomonas sp. R5(2019)]NBA97757.1 hypothetical protein [Pseudomonas sp. R5(2019)]